MINPFSFLNNLNIQKKLNLNLAILTLFMAVLVAVGWFTIKEVKHGFHQVLDGPIVMRDLMRRIYSDVQSTRSAQRQFLLTLKEEYADEVRKKVTSAIEKLARLSKLDNEFGHHKDEIINEQIRSLMADYLDAFDDMAKAMQVKGLEDNNGLRGELGRTATELVNLLQNFDTAEVYIYFVKLRFHEKAYQITNQQQELAAWGDALKLLSSALLKSEILHFDKDKYKEFLSQYQKNFQDIVEKRKEGIQTTDIQTELLQIGEILRPMEEGLQKYYIRNISLDLANLRRYEREYLHIGEQRYANRFMTSLKKMLENVENANEVPEKMRSDVINLLNSYRQNMQNLVDQDKEISRQRDVMRMVVEKFEPILNEHILMAEEDVRQAEEDINTKSARLLVWMVIIGIVAVLLGGLLVWFFVKRITDPLTQIATAMQKLEKGEKHSDMPVIGNDELGIMARIFNRMSHEISRNAAELHQEKNKLTTIIYSAKEAILVSDAEGNVVLVNPEAERLLKKTAEEIVMGGFLNLVDDPDYLQTFMERQGIGMPETLVYKDRVLHFYAATIKNEEGQNIGSAALIRDVTEEKKLAEKLHQMSFTDKLTGLYNRRWMEDILNKEFSRASRYGTELSLLFLDVDHFKKFNDTYGHNMGDRVLEVIGNSAKICFRKNDVSCRYGGEEFCIILPSTGPEGARIAAEHFRKDVESLRVDGLQVTITIGVVSFPKCHCQTPEELLKAADSALYEGKRTGRNRIIIWEPSEADK